MAVEGEALPLAVLYLRMSSDKQDMSISDQRVKVMPWSKGRYRIVEEYVDEGKSGSKHTAKRTEFLRMVNDLTEGRHAGTVRYVVSVDKSRFDRLDTLDGAEFKRALREAGIRFDSPMNGLIDWSTPIGRMMDTVLSEANHHTPLVIAEKGLQGRIRVTKEGRPNQTTPYGMAKRVTTPTGEAVVVSRGQRFATPKTWKSAFCPGEPGEVEAVRFLFQTFVAEDISYNELSRRAQERGFPKPGVAGEWLGDTISWMLRNPVYAGGLRIGVQPKGQFFQTRGEKETPRNQASSKPEPVYVWGCHEGIVEKELWERVQAKIGRSFKTRRPPRNSGPYALSGIIHCGKCGRPMYGSRNHGGGVIYRCHRGEISATKCGYWIAYEGDILSVLLFDFLGSIRHEIIRATCGPEPVPVSDEATRLRKELVALEAKLEQGREAVLDAPKQLRAGLLANLEKREQRKSELEDQLGRMAGKAQGRWLLEWWEQYRQKFFTSSPVDIGAGRLLEPSDPEVVANRRPDPLHEDPGIHGVPLKSGDSVLAVKTKVPASVLREKLKQIGTEVYVWFQKRPIKKGYDLHRIRAKARMSGEVCYEYASNAAS